MSPAAEEHLPISEQEKQVIATLADISGKKGFRGLAPLLSLAGVPETYSHGEEIELACLALCLPEDQGISSERIFWDFKQNNMLLPDGSTVDTYSIGVYDERGMGTVWEWGKNNTHMVIRSITNRDGLEETQTVLTIEKGVCTVEQHNPDLEPQKIRLVGKGVVPTLMILNSLPQKFSQLQDCINGLKRDELQQQKAIGRAARMLINGLYNKERNAAYDGAFAQNSMTSIALEKLGEDLMEIANVNYNLSTGEIIDILPLFISAQGAILHAERINIQLPGLQQNIHIVLTKNDIAAVAVYRSTPFMPTRVLPSMTLGIPARFNVLNTILWEAQPVEVELVGVS